MFGVVIPESMSESEGVCVSDMGGRIWGWMGIGGWGWVMDNCV